VLNFHIDEVQTTFINLLSDPKCKHLSRESCCLGLAACRGLIQSQSNSTDTTQELNNKLLRAFGQTTSFAGSALVESQNEARQRRAALEGQDIAPTGVDDNPHVDVGGASGITEAALGAFKEMASAAVSLNRPDVLYTLLILSVSHPFWFTPGNRNAYRYDRMLYIYLNYAFLTCGLVVFMQFCCLTW
jgi:proteasome component ECM29